MLTREDIKNEIRENWAQFEREPSDAILEFVDSALPVYYNDIISQWHKDMPNEYWDSWKDTLGTVTPKETGICDLMTHDLWNWYYAEWSEAYECLRVEIAPAYDGEICECVFCETARFLAEARSEQAG